MTADIADDRPDGRPDDQPDDRPGDQPDEVGTGRWAELRRLRPTSIVVIAGRRGAPTARSLTAEFPAATVHLWLVRARLPPLEHPGVVCRHVTSPDELSALFRALPAPDVVIDDGWNHTSYRIRCFEESFLHLRNGGVYVADRIQRDREPSYRDGPGGLWDWLAGLVGRMAAPSAGSEPTGAPVDRGLAPAVRRISTDGRSVLVERRGDHVVKLHDKDATVELTSRLGESWGAELVNRATRPLTVTSTPWQNRDGVHERFETEIKIPRLRVRRYDDAVCVPRQLVLVGDAVPPVAFHHPHGKRLKNRALRNVAVDVDVLRRPLGEPAPLPGTYYHLDSEFPGHFGHFMTEDLSRLWWWDEARRTYPGIKVLISTEDGSGTLKPYARTALNAFGISDDEIVCFDAPVRVERLIGVSPMYHNGRFAHPALTDVWDRVRSAFVPRFRTPPSIGGGASGRRKIFVARAPGQQRECHQYAEIEDLFASQGFQVVRPEKLDFAEQVNLFHEARVVAGYGGSGLFGAIFCRRLAAMIVIASESYYATNEWLISTVKGNAYHHFWGPADHEGFHSDYRFDLATDGADLLPLLRRL